MQVSNTPQKPLTGRRIFIYLLIFFGVITAVNAVFITKALQSNSGVVHDNPYERGLDYNKILDKREQQKALGWKGKTIFAEDTSSLVYSLSDRSGQPVAGAKVVAHMLRPVQKGYDFSVDMVETSPGQYSAALKLPLKGAWKAHISVVSGGDSYDDETSLDIE